MIGLLGTAVGVGAGLLLNRWIITSTMSTTMPDMALDIVISAGTVLTAIAFGMIAVAIAPLFTARRLRRMDIPGTSTWSNSPTILARGPPHQCREAGHSDRLRPRSSAV